VNNGDSHGSNSITGEYKWQAITVVAATAATAPPTAASITYRVGGAVKAVVHPARAINPDGFSH